MASLGELLQRVAQSLEEAGERGPADDLRARLGYGAGHEDDDELAEDAFPEPAAETTRPEHTRRKPETVWKPPAPRTRARPVADSGAGPMRAPAAEAALRRSSPSRAPPSSPTTAGMPLPERIRARLHGPDALREAFVVKEILDRPLARRRRGFGMR